MRNYISLLVLSTTLSGASPLLFTKGALVRFKEDPAAHMSPQALFHKCNQVKIWIIRDFTLNPKCKSHQRYILASKMLAPYDENAPNEVCNLQFKVCGEDLELIP